MKENFEVRDVVLLKTNYMNRNGWPMARVVEKMPGKDERIRSVKLRIGSKNNSDQTLIRPITKLDFLVRNEDAEKHRTKFGCQKRPGVLRGAR